MARPYPTRRMWAVFSLLVLSGVVMLSFQNCGKAGFGEVGEGGLGSMTSASISGDQRIQSAPMPFDANLNHIAVMTCPMAGASTRREPLDTSNPFFNVRAGAFDNTSYAEKFNLTSLSTEEKNRRLRAGIGLKQEFINHIQANYLRSDADILAKGISGSSKTQNLKLTLALINENGQRSKGAGGFGHDYQSYSPLLDTLSGPTMVNYLANAERNGSSGTLKQSFFSGFDPSQRAMVGSISWGKSEIDRDSLMSKLGGSLALSLGYMDTSLATDITSLASPSGDAYKTVYGKGYRLLMGQQAARFGNEGYHIAAKSHLLKGVEELDMEQQSNFVINSSMDPKVDVGRKWDCFSLVIVRHIDRLDFYTNKPMTYCRSPVAPFNLTTQDSGVCDTKLSTGNTIKYGVKRICPVQTITSLNETSNQVSPPQQLNMLRLAMARRVLPAEHWEINTDPKYLCAVPTEAAMARGKCYSVGDEDATKFVQYNVGSACGPGNDECPSYVSICYRTK